MSTLLHECKAPRHKRKEPPLTTFWRRFGIRHELVEN